ncbi:alpha-2-macroglobulin family protein, partial [Pseudomonas aeruginosa]
MSEISRVALFGKLNSLAYKAIEAATVFCKLRGNPYVELVHWFHQILQLPDSDLHQIVRQSGIDPARLAKDLTEALDRLPRGSTSITDLSSHVEEAVERGWVYGSLMFGESQVRTGYLVIGLLKTPSLRHALTGLSAEFAKLKVEALTERFDEYVGASPENGLSASDGFNAGAAPGEASGALAPSAMGKQEALKRFTVDLTEQARSGKLDPIVGRDEEIRQLVDILMRRRQNNPILTGEAGVGKTAVVEGFALRIVAGDVPPALKDVELRALDVGLLQAGVDLAGVDSKTVSLSKGERTQVQIPITAKHGFGQGEFSLSIYGIKVPNEEIKPYQNTWKIGVRPAYPAETIHYANTLADGESWRLPNEALNQFNRSTLEGELLLTSRPPLQVARYVRELFAYPYGCLEQTVSGLYPSLYSTEKELKQLGIKTQTDMQRKEAIEKGIAHILTMQKSEGGFALWAQGGREEFWLTAYATDFLFRASQQGYEVPTEALKRANDRLLRYLQDKNIVNEEYVVNQDAARFSARAYAALVLANQQKAPLGELRRLYLERNQAGSGLALVQLGVALKLMGDNSRAESLIAEGVTMPRKYNYGLGDYGSTIRDQALIIALLSENNLETQTRDASVITLSDNLTGREWFSTQESNSLYLAGRFFIDMAEKPWEVTINRQVPAMSSDRAVNEALTATQLQEGLELNNQGGTTIYSRMNVVGYPKVAPAPYSNVLKINRSYYDLKGNRVDPNRLQSGEMLVVKLEVSANRDVPDALVVDILPAGLEIENQNLASSSASLSDSAADLQEFIDDMGQANIKHLESRDDRFVAAIAVDKYRPTTLLYLARAVTPGSYQVPPPQVES